MFSDCGPLPEGVYAVVSVVDPPAGTVSDPSVAEKPVPLCVTPERVSVASPTFWIVKSNAADVSPTFTRPKSFEEGATVMTGPLTAAARAASQDETCASRSGLADAAEGTRRMPKTERSTERTETKRGE